MVALLLGDGPRGLVALGVGLLAAVGLLVAAIVGAAGLLGGVVAITAAVIISTRAIILFAKKEYNFYHIGKTDRSVFSDLGRHDAGSLAVVIGVAIEVGGAFASLLVDGVVLAHARRVLHLQAGVIVLGLNFSLVDRVAHSFGNLKKYLVKNILQKIDSYILLCDTFGWRRAPG